jgi:hypothetical protein
MKRIPEPELMNEASQARAYAEADFSEPNQLFMQLFTEHFPGFDGATVVDLGCGPADILSISAVVRQILLLISRCNIPMRK